MPLHPCSSSPTFVMSRVQPETTDRQAKNFLTEPEMSRLLAAAKQGRYGIARLCPAAASAIAMACG